MNSKLFSFINKEIKRYSVLAEADSGVLDMSKINDTDDDKARDTDEMSEDTDKNETLTDPTKTTEEDMSDGNAFVSDTKLANFASTLLKAYQTSPKEQIPSEFLDVTPENANKVIKYIEDKLTLNTPTEDIVDNLGNI